MFNAIYGYFYVISFFFRRQFATIETFSSLLMWQNKCEIVSASVAAAIKEKC
jgi:hypothetical protein